MTELWQFNRFDAASTCDYPDIIRIFENGPICMEFFLKDVKWRDEIKTHQNNVFWCLLRPFFRQKQALLGTWTKRTPPGTFFETVLHPYLLIFFKAVFAITSGKELKMIS